MLGRKGGTGGGAAAGSRTTVLRQSPQTSGKSNLHGASKAKPEKQAGPPTALRYVEQPGGSTFVPPTLLLERKWED